MFNRIGNASEHQDTLCLLDDCETKQRAPGFHAGIINTLIKATAKTTADIHSCKTSFQKKMHYYVLVQNSATIMLFAQCFVALELLGRSPTFKASGVCSKLL